MKKYIFYTTEGFTQAPDGEDIENCQLLGCACGQDKQEAMDTLLKENPWIKERNFEPRKAICEELTTTPNAEDKLSFITSLLDERQLEAYSNWLKKIE